MRWLLDHVFASAVSHAARIVLSSDGAPEATPHVAPSPSEMASQYVHYACSTQPIPISCVSSHSNSCLLLQFTEVVEKLSIIASQQQPPSIAHTAAVSNLQGALQDLRSAYRRQAASLRERRQEELLLAEARQRQGGAGGGRDGHSSATDMLLRERGALTQSHSVVDEILSRAAETTSTLARQRSAISTAAGRLGGVAGRIPGLQGLMQAIHSRRIKNEVIMALVIATLICFTIWWVWPRSSSSSSGTA